MPLKATLKYYVEFELSTMLKGGNVGDEEGGQKVVILADINFDLGTKVFLQKVS